MRHLTRRKFLGASLASLAGVGGAYAYARCIEPRWLDVVHLNLPLKNLPEAFNGFTIAQISDLHLGPFMNAAQVEPIIDAVLALDADAIVLTGDIVSRLDHGEADVIENALARLRARHEVFAILGNHDWWNGASTVVDALHRAGIIVLSNRHHPWKRDGQKLYLAGVDDVWCDRHDFARALRGIPPAAAVVALVHEPDYADVVTTDSRVILQLSGHSHGGQLCVPFVGGVWFPPWARKYPCGLYHINDLMLYTSRGVGMARWQVRFACRPEVTRITLTRD